MLDTIDRLKNELNDTEADCSIDDIARHARRLNDVGLHLARTDQALKASGCENQHDFIAFFKTVRPHILCELYKAKELLRIGLRLQFLPATQHKAFMESRLKIMEEFALGNFEFYACYLSGRTDQDVKYFSMKDDACIGGHDDILGQLLANEWLCRTIKDYLVKPSDSDLLWSGSKSDLMELILALSAAGCVNNGKVEIKKLAIAFESMFAVKLHGYYDISKKIRMRKKGLTNFIDTLRQKLAEHLEEMNR